MLDHALDAPQQDHGPGHQQTGEAAPAGQTDAGQTGGATSFMPGIAPGVLQRKIARRMVQRQTHGHGTGGAAADTATEITPEQSAAAIAWSQTAHPAAAMIRDLQRTLGVAVTGAYDAATAAGVFARQRQLQPHGAIAHAGQANTDFCRRIGLIFYTEAAPATVGDPVIDDIRQRFPNGLTVALYANLARTGNAAHDANNAEFQRKAVEFARNQHAVGLVGGAVTVGVPVPISQLPDLLVTVNSIHRGLLQKYRQSQAAAAGPHGAAATGEGAAGAAAGGAGATAAAEPAFTKILNLALFSHGESWGMGMNSANDFSVGGLHNNTTRGLYPSNVQAFANGLSEGVVPGVRVELFACSTGADEQARSQSWGEHEQGARFGQNSFGQSLATALGPQATVSAHTTAGHTTENYAARVFGAEAGGGSGGVHMFDTMYPETFVQSELLRLFADRTDEQRVALHNPLREKMWAHYRASTDNNGTLHGAYPIPIGQEEFTNPSHARELLHAHFTTWIASNMPRPPAPAHRRS